MKTALARILDVESEIDVSILVIWGADVDAKFDGASIMDRILNRLIQSKWNVYVDNCVKLISCGAYISDIDMTFLNYAKLMSHGKSK
jgi:hypothetical protein